MEWPFRSHRVRGGESCNPSLRHLVVQKLWLSNAQTCLSSMSYVCRQRPLQMHAHYCCYWRVTVTRLQKFCAARSEEFNEFILKKSWLERDSNLVHIGPEVNFTPKKFSSHQTAIFRLLTSWEHEQVKLIIFLGMDPSVMK